MKKINPVIILVLFIWVVFIIDLIFPIDLTVYGIIPNNYVGLRGIILGPFIHANYYHILSNTVPLIVLSSILFIYYYDKAYQVLIWSIILSGLGVWIFGRPHIHVGISGIIYSFLTFIILAGFLKRKFWNIIISLLVIGVYGGLVWGLLPDKFYISYEWHIAGAASGIFLAWIFYRKKKR